MNSRAQGDFALGLAIAYFSSKKAVVYLPLTDTHDADMAIVFDNEILLIEVKSSATIAPSGNFIVNLVSKRHNATENRTTYLYDRNFDFLFVATIKGDIYLFPKEFLANRNSITLNPIYDEYKVSYGDPSIMNMQLHDDIIKIEKSTNTKNDGKFKCYYCHNRKTIDNFIIKKGRDMNSISRRDYNSACVECMGDVIKSKLRVLK